jgi:hypothetical protein
MAELQIFFNKNRSSFELLFWKRCLRLHRGDSLEVGYITQLQDAFIVTSSADTAHRTG